MLEQIFLNQSLGSLGPTNFLKHALAWGVSQGYSLEVLALLLLLPLALTVVALTRYLIGIQGLGLFAPIIIAVAFLATGLTAGLLLFLGILLVEILAILILRRLKIHFAAKMALVLLIVCLALLPLMFIFLKVEGAFLFNASLVPILILILIGENLAELQLRKAPKLAFLATVETFLMAALAFGILSSNFLKRAVLFYPEAIMALIILLDIWIGHFTGLRLLEYRRFRKLLKK
ncbi:hypothetical protein FJZ41_03740 [Candidatus Shapirobacteria bacterium]|nr:hypothetical protein [Candidatus Shapirobacteria bacterium]